MVETKLLGKPSGGMVATKPEAVHGVLKQLGKERLTQGCVRHQRSSLILGSFPLPKSLVINLIMKAVKETHENKKLE